jgi:hypothetical protein
MVADLRKRFWACLLLTLPVLALSPMIQHMHGLEDDWRFAGIWATGYNVIAIPAPAGALAHWGIVLGPAVGAVLMSASTVVSAVNARMLRLN